MVYSTVTVLLHMHGCAVHRLPDCGYTHPSGAINMGHKNATTSGLQQSILKMNVIWEFIS
jgi:hypothetical protein